MVLSSGLILSTDVWIRRWLPRRLSKRQSLSTTTVPFRTTFTRTIKLNLLLKWLLGWNLSQWNKWVDTAQVQNGSTMRTRNKKQISMQEYREKASDKQRGRASPNKKKHWESLQITKKGPAWRAKKQAHTFPLADYIWNKKARVGHYIVHSQAERRLSNFTIHVDLINQYTDR